MIVSLYQRPIEFIKKVMEVWNESSHNLLWMILVLRLRNLAFLSIAKALAVQGYCSIWWTGHWILLMAGKNDKICYICFMTSIHLRNKILFLKNCGLHKAKEILKYLNFCKKNLEIEVPMALPRLVTYLVWTKLKYWSCTMYMCTQKNKVL